jgi:hypothetical protein
VIGLKEQKKPSGQYYHRPIILVAGILACFTCLPLRAAEYCLRPGKKDATQADSVICCTTPAGWRGWKDDPGYWDRIKRLDPYTKEWFNRLVPFHQPNCKQGPECPYLSLRVTARDSRGQPDVEAGLRNLLEELEQPQDLSSRKLPCVVVSRFGSFHIENSGDVTIYQIRCPSGSQQLMTLFAQSDVLVTIELGGPDIKDTVHKVDSLKELARSVRIIDANLALPDIVEIKIDHVSDAAIKQQLFRLTPVGTPIEKVYDVLQSHLYREVHRIKGDLWIELGSYSKAVSQPTATKSWPPSEEEIRSQVSAPVALPPTTIVKAVWKFDKRRKLRDIEIKREVVEFRPQQ